MTDQTLRILVIGGGTIGHGIAHQAAMKGFRVTVADQTAAALETSKSLVRSHMASMKELGLTTDEENEAIFPA